MAQDVIEQAAEQLAAAVAPDETEPEAAPDTSTEAGPEPEEAEEAAPEPEAEPAPDTSKLVRENARLARALERRQAEVKTAEGRIAELESIAKERIGKADLSKIERVLGVTADEYGDVEIGGQKMPAAVAAQFAEVVPRLEMLERTVLSQREETQRADFGEAVLSTISQIRTGDPVLSQLAPEAAEDVEEYMAFVGGGPVMRAYDEGTLTREQIAESLSAALDKAKRFAGNLGVAQVKANKQHAEIEKLKPGGTAAVPAEKPWHEMSRREQDQLARRERELLEQSPP